MAARNIAINTKTYLCYFQKIGEPNETALGQLDELPSNHIYKCKPNVHSFLSLEIALITKQLPLSKAIHNAFNKKIHLEQPWVTCITQEQNERERVHGSSYKVFFDIQCSVVWDWSFDKYNQVDQYCQNSFITCT